MKLCVQFVGCEGSTLVSRAESCVDNSFGHSDGSGSVDVSFPAGIY